MSIEINPTLDAWEGRVTEKSIAVLMSGGVDSAVTAMLLKREGWDAVGFTMKIPSPRCEGRTELDLDAVNLCRHLEMPHYLMETDEVFEKSVVEPFRQSYLEGRTPNPCVGCNSSLKFGKVWDEIEHQFGITHLATGHYARVLGRGNNTRLARARDEARDQTYFIYGLDKKRLPYLHLPLGEYTKIEAREMAAKYHLVSADRPDSMELCFAGERDYRSVLNLPEVEGKVVDTDGNVMAEHNGIWNFTIGQRKRLGFASTEPKYVLSIDPVNNRVIVGSRDEACRSDVTAARPNILISEKYTKGAKLRGKIRSLSGLSECTITGADPERISVSFTEPQFGPTPGQHLVLYDENDCVVAGGEIIL